MGREIQMAVYTTTVWFSCAHDCRSTMSTVCESLRQAIKVKHVCTSDGIWPENASLEETVPLFRSYGLQECLNELHSSKSDRLGVGPHRVFKYWTKMPSLAPSALHSQSRKVYVPWKGNSQCFQDDASMGVASVRELLLGMQKGSCSICQHLHLKRQ